MPSPHLFFNWSLNLSIGHVDMVKFLLDAGADQEHKTDEMHTALMEASMVSTECIAKVFNGA
jgi:ankyrin repeat protein